MIVLSIKFDKVDIKWYNKQCSTCLLSSKIILRRSEIIGKIFGEITDYIDTKYIKENGE